jgi:hypothetical protein
LASVIWRVWASARAPHIAVAEVIDVSVLMQIPSLLPRVSLFLQPEDSLRTCRNFPTFQERSVRRHSSTVVVGVPVPTPQNFSFVRFNRAACRPATRAVFRDSSGWNVSIGHIAHGIEAKCSWGYSGRKLGSALRIFVGFVREPKFSCMRQSEGMPARSYEVHSTFRNGEWRGEVEPEPSG